MPRSKERIFKIHHREALELFVDRGRNKSDSYDSTFLPENLADTATRIQKAIAERFERSDGPFRSAEAMRAAAAETALPSLPPTPLSRNLFEAVTAQPAQFDGRLGPNVAAAVRTIGEAVRQGLLYAPTSIMTVTRTIERRHMRRRATVGGRRNRLEDQGIVVGPIAAGGGASFAFGTHPPTQDRGDVPAAVLRYHETRTGVELNPLTARMSMQAAVWQDLHETMGRALPVVHRGERRFAPLGSEIGTATSDELWHAATQPGWLACVSQTFDAGAIVLGEVPTEWLTGMTYRSPLGERKIVSARRFLDDVELKAETLLVRSVEMSSKKGRLELEGADPVVTLEGRLIADDGSAYAPVFVTSGLHSDTVVYVIPAERAAKMGQAEWEAVRRALAALHGTASVRSSDDQGRGLSLPFEKGFTVTSSNPDKACNYDAFRFFIHAVGSDGHWRPDWDAEDGCEEAA